MAANPYLPRESEARAQIMNGGNRPSRAADYLEAARAYAAERLDSARNFASEKYGAFSRYLKEASDAAAVEADMFRNGYSTPQKKRAGALAATTALAMLYLATLPAVSSGQSTDTPPKPPGASQGQGQPPDTEKTQCVAPAPKILNGFEAHVEEAKNSRKDWLLIGTDFYDPLYPEVYSAATGVISYLDRGIGSFNQDIPWGWQLFYGHVDEINPSLRVGSPFPLGKLLGKVSTKGFRDPRATSPRLFLGVGAPEWHILENKPGLGEYFRWENPKYKEARKPFGVVHLLNWEQHFKGFWDESLDPNKDAEGSWTLAGRAVNAIERVAGDRLRGVNLTDESHYTSREARLVKALTEPRNREWVSKIAIKVPYYDPVLRKNIERLMTGGDVLKLLEEGKRWKPVIYYPFKSPCLPGASGN